MTAHNPDASNNITSPASGRRRRRQGKRRQANIVSPDVRAARARILAEHDVRAQATRETETRAAQRPVEAFREALTFASDMQLEELHRSVGRIDSRTQQDAVADIIKARARFRHAAAIASSSVAPAPTTATMPVEPPESPARGRGRPKATVTA